MKKISKYSPKASDVKPVTLDAFRLAGMDLFELIVDMDKLMHAYGMPTIQFMNDIRNTDITNEFQAYCILDNGLKLTKLNPNGRFQGIMELPRNSYLRNGIGHNNYKYDGISQKVIAFDLKNPEIVRYQGRLMDVALACVGMAKSTVGISEIILFLLRREFKKEGIRTILHPRFYNGSQPNDKCPCGSGIKYKKCCKSEIENISKQKI